MVLVNVMGHDGSRKSCSIDVAARQKPQLVPATPLENQALRGPRYTPASMPEPFLRCGRNEPVLTGRGRLLGWLTRTDERRVGKEWFRKCRSRWSTYT